MSWQEAQDALHAHVEALRAEGERPEVVAELTEAARKATLSARSAAFAHGTQGRGARMTYGTGVPPEPKKKKGQRK